MYRGQTRFHCDNCGNRFMGPDYEWNCTVLSCPVKCPECGSGHTYTHFYLKGVYKKIWTQQDESFTS